MRRRRGGPGPELPPESIALVEARLEGRVLLGSFALPEAARLGMGGVDAADDPPTPDPAASRIPSGALGVGRSLFKDHSRAVAGWGQYPIGSRTEEGSPMWRLAVVDADPPDVVLVQRPEGEDPGRDLVLELVRSDLLAAELAAFAYRAPRDEDERDASPGLESVFTGPDRKARAVPTRLFHDWDAPRARMVRWAYTMTIRPEPGDWVGRRPQTIHRVTQELYRKHLLWRLGKPTVGL